MKITSMLLGVSFAALTLSPVFAEENSWYAAVRGGITSAEDSKLDSSITGLAGDADHNDGIVFGASIGRDMGDVQLEFELVRRQNSVDSLTISSDAGLGTGAGLFSADGHTNSTAGMFNLYYAPDVDFSIKPYAGFGMGVANLSYNGYSVGNVALVDDSKTVFAYQGIVGLRHAISKAVDLTLDYRYFTTEDPKLHDALGRRFEGDYASHSVMVGLVWRFGGAQKTATAAPEPTYAAAPAPAAPKVEPAAGPEPVGPFIVYFDWDSSAITADAAKILDQAAAAAKDRAPIKIILKGHADTSGPGRYNDKLAEHRAAVVEQELVSRGLAEETIGVESYGENLPALTTGDGVREAKNRRVEITIE